MPSRSQFFRRFIESLMIRPKDRPYVVPFVFNEAQELAWNQYIAPCLDERKSIRLIILKARQLGISTLIQGLLTARFVWDRLVNEKVIAHEGESTKNIWSMADRMIEHCPFHPYVRRVGTTMEMGDSRYSCSTAGSPHATRSMNLTALHCCLSGDSLVLLADGTVRAIQEIQIGDVVLTHTGSPAPVTAISCRPSSEVRGSGQGFSISIWLSALPIVATPDHKFWTKRGWIEAQHLTTHDFIACPLPQLRDCKRDLPLRLINSSRPQGGGAQPISGSLPLTREMGFFCGYYLAEGSISQQYKYPHRCNSITLTMHANEWGYGQRALNAVSPWIRSMRWDDRRPLAQTRQLTMYGVSLAETVAQEFGRKDRKQLPSWIFDAPREFLIGVLDGYLAGDGSKGLSHHQRYESPTIQVTSICPQLIIQIRRLIGALGLGWAGIRRKPAYTDEREWKCREAWTLQINGMAAIHVREALEWQQPSDIVTTQERRHRAQKYQLDKGVVWVKVKRVIPTSLGSVWDIEVDHPDHSFDTIAGAVANSEVAFWPHPEAWLAAMQTVPIRGESWVLIESTPNGKVGDGKLFYDEWTRASAGKSKRLRPLFIPWHILKEYELPNYVYSEQWKKRLHKSANVVEELDTEEQQLKAEHQVSAGKMAWRRHAIDDCMAGDVTAFRQEFPSKPEECFRAMK